MPPWCSGSPHCCSGSAPDTYWCECGGVCCVLAPSEFGVLFVSAFAMSHPNRTFSLRLSKSRYTAGTQCQKLLWWKVDEPLGRDSSFRNLPELPKGCCTTAITRARCLLHVFGDRAAAATCGVDY